MPKDNDNEDDSVEEKTPRLRLQCSKAEDFLESLTVSICLFGIFLTGETIIVVSQIFGYYTEVAQFESLISSMSLIFHTGTIIVSIIAHACNHEYFTLHKFRIEASIVLVDTVNLYLSIRASKNGDSLSARAKNLTLAITILGGVAVFLHAIRIFHVFYRTLKPKTEKREQQSRVSSIQGIFINQKYSGMRFCFEQLMQPLEEGLSRVFSLQFYGTREKEDGGKGNSYWSLVDGAESVAGTTRESSSQGNNCFCFRTGRPDWESVFTRAMHKAHFSETNGETIGVFFCGAPAIAKSIRSVADQVSAHHQYEIKKKRGTACNCKISVHVENY